jgi:polyhydroxyalkanoate synthesis regulator phasin
MAAFGQQQQILSRFSLAAILLSPSMLHALKREIRTYSSTIKVEEENLKDLLQTEVFKREVVDSEDAKKAVEFLKKTIKSTTKPAPKKKPDAIKNEATKRTDNILQPTEENNIALPQPPVGGDK